VKPRHAVELALVIAWYLMAPPSMREDSWSCSDGLLATLSHDLFGTGDQKVCEQWEKIADVNSPLSKWHEMGSFETLDACEKVRDGYAALPGSQPQNVAQCFETGEACLTGRGHRILVR
jgi:hypothetical protein